MSGIFTALIFAAAALLHGMSGIGFPLITTSVLSLSHTMQQAVVLTLLPTLLINGISMAGGTHGFVQIVRDYGWLAVGSVAGSLLGVRLLLLLPSAPLQLALAVVIMLYIALSLKPRQWQLPQGGAAALLFGLAAGVVGGATNAMSPVLMMYLLAVSRDQNRIAQAANLCFFLGKLTQLAVLYPHLAALHPADIRVAAYGSLLAVVFLWMGSKLRQRVSYLVFRRLSLLILGVLSLLLFYKGITG